MDAFTPISGAVAPAQHPQPSAMSAQAPHAPPSLDGRALSGLFAGLPPNSRERRRSRLPFLSLIVAIAAAGGLLTIRYGVPRRIDQQVATPGPLIVERRGPATIDAVNRAVVSARVQGRIVAIHVDRSDLVEPGQVIAEIASDDLRSRLDSAGATLDAARLVLVQAKAQADRSEAAATKAEATFRRQATLLEKGSSSPAAHDEAQAARQQANAELRSARSAIGQAEAQERAAAAAVELARADLDGAAVRAPIRGVVISRSQNVGNLATSGTPIIEIVDPSTIVLTARFDESTIASISPGQPAELLLVSQPGDALAGHVLRVGRQVDPETREFTVDIVPHTLPSNWAIGQRGTAVIAVGTKTSVISVPSRDLVRRGGQAGVWTSVGGRARWTAVVPGEIGGALVEIKSGLNAGDILLSPGRVFAGMRVAAAGERQ